MRRVPPWLSVIARAEHQCSADATPGRGIGASVRAAASKMATGAGSAGEDCAGAPVVEAWKAPERRAVTRVVQAGPLIHGTELCRYTVPPALRWLWFRLPAWPGPKPVRLPISGAARCLHRHRRSSLANIKWPASASTGSKPSPIWT
jgi:hypothetical protein